MAVVITHSARSTRLMEVRGLVDALRRKSETLDALELALISEGQDLASVNAAIQAVLTSFTDDIDAIGALVYVSVVHKASVTAGMPALNTSLQLLKCWNGYSIIQPRDSSNWSGPFAASDVVSLSGCEDSGNDGVYTVVAAGDGSSQAEILQYGDFGADYDTSKWTDTNWAQLGDHIAHATGNTSALIQPVASMVSAGAAFSNGKAIYGSITVSGMTAGTLTIDCGTAPDLVISANGSYGFFLIADGANFTMTPTSLFDGSIENVSLVRVLGLVLDRDIEQQNNADTSCVVTLEER